MFFTIRSIRDDVFTWLDSVQDSLERGQSVIDLAQQASPSKSETNEEGSDDENDYGFFEQKGVPYRIDFQKMKELIQTHIEDFVQMDPA